MRCLTPMVSMILASKGANPSVKSILRDFSFMIKNVFETKFDIKKRISVLASYMDINECDSSLFFECTKRVVRLWIANEKCSMRFIIHDLQSIYDLRTETNYHKNGGHVLLFTEDFENEKLLPVKKMLETVFSPFDNVSVERCICFYHVDNKIFMRNYTADGVDEIGPRLEIELDLVLDGCFKGKTIYRKKENEENNEISNLEDKN